MVVANKTMTHAVINDMNAPKQRPVSRNPASSRLRAPREAPMSIRLESNLRRLVTAHCLQEDMTTSQFVRRALKAELRRIGLIATSGSTP